MIWCSGWKLAAAVSNAGGLGLIGAGSMYPDVFEHHLTKCREATDKPFGVNLPLLYPDVDKLIDILLRHEIKIVFTSAGNPAKYTSFFKDYGLTVVHVIANRKFALKAVQAGVDAIVAEGFEAGGHNGFEETTTLTLIPLIRQITDIPLLAAGGIATGRQMLAAIALGAEGVQVGSRFAASTESSAHESFKHKIVEAGEGDTRLQLKSLVPVRLLKNAFADQVFQAELHGASSEELAGLLGKSRAKKGMFEGDMDEGELEIGQVSAIITEIKPAAEIIQEMMDEFNQAGKELINLF